MTTDLVIRLATPDDAAAIANIYNQGIRDRIATLETSERTAEERRTWLADRDERHPVFLAESTGRQVGWAALNPFSPRLAYRYVVEFSIYIDSQYRGMGIGHRLLEKLIEEAKRLEYHKMVLAAFPFNQAGMRLYERHGFREVGRYREQGVLEGRWVDTVIMELLLDDNPPPAP